MVTICSDTSSKAHGNDSVTRAKVKGETEVLGRKNDTHLSGGGKEEDKTLKSGKRMSYVK